MRNSVEKAIQTECEVYEQSLHESSHDKVLHWVLLCSMKYISMIATRKRVEKAAKGTTHQWIVRWDSDGRNVRPGPGATIIVIIVIIVIIL